MTALTWAAPGQKRWETGVDKGVLYRRDSGGAYTNGYAWPGLTAVTESPSGAESNKQYADNGVYANLKSAEEFNATIEAFTYPDEFAACDGSAEPEPGVTIGQQKRESFGFSYRTRIGNDLDEELGYKIHLIYGADAAPSEVSRATVNDSPELAGLSWEISTVPTEVGNIGGVDYRPTSHLTVDSTKVAAADLAELEDMLYGTVGDDPFLPTPAAVIAIFAGALVEAVPTEPAYNAGTGVITIPTITGVTYYMDGEALAAGAQPAITENQVVEARPNAGYKFPAVIDSDWFFDAP